MINYDSPRGGVSVITEKGEVTTSYLLVQRAQTADSGQYTCHPSNANTKTVLVHVLNGMYIYIYICMYIYKDLRSFAVFQALLSTLSLLDSLLRRGGIKISHFFPFVLTESG